MNRTLFGLSLALGALAAGSGASAEQIVSTDQLTARLVSEAAQVRPGDTVTVALHQAIAPGWHTYWKNPGDSGQAPSLAWDLPEGARIEAGAWPAPHRMPYGPLVNYGYETETALLFDLTVPETWPAGTAFPIAAEAELLACAEICIPVWGRVAFDLPTGAETRLGSDAAALIAAARAAQPEPLPWPAAAVVEDGRLSLTVAMPGAGRVTEAYVFAAEWGVLDHAAPQQLAAGEAGLGLNAPLGAATLGPTVSGVLRLTFADAPDRAFVFEGVSVSTP